MRQRLQVLALVVMSLVPLAASQTLSRAETAKLVKDDLARRLKVDAAELTLVSESDETWPDATLGCPGRKPLGEPSPTSGFAFTFSHRGRSYVYHADRSGHFRRCETAKPIKPIGR